MGLMMGDNCTNLLILALEDTDLLKVECCYLELEGLNHWLIVELCVWWCWLASWILCDVDEWQQCKVCDDICLHNNYHVNLEARFGSHIRGFLMQLIRRWLGRAGHYYNCVERDDLSEHFTTCERRVLCEESFEGSFFHSWTFVYH